MIVIAAIACSLSSIHLDKSTDLLRTFCSPSHDLHAPQALWRAMITIQAAVIAAAAYRVPNITRNEESLTQQWRSPACQRFYADRLPEVVVERFERASDAQIPLRTMTLEDLHLHGRGAAMHPAHLANEVVVSHEYKFVYVEVRKAASSTIRAILSKHFNVDFMDTNCAGNATGKACRVLGGRCSTLCLTENIVNNYLIFSFVRDPVERFYSSFKQALVMHRRKSASRPEMARVLCIMVLDATVWDHHLETQAFSLSSGIDLSTNTSIDPKGMLPFAFIGSASHLKRDFQAILQLIERTSMMVIPQKRAILAELSVRKNAGGGIKDRILEHRDTLMDDFVRLVYAQDVACCGSNT